VQIDDRVFEWGERTYLMAVLNVTPDSFSDGGNFNSVAKACAQALRLVKAGQIFWMWVANLPGLEPSR
jgi:dihydropteroate synthase